MRPPLGADIRVTWLDAALDTSDAEQAFDLAANTLNVRLEDQLVRSRGRLVQYGPLNLVMAIDDSSMHGSVESVRGLYRIPISLVVMIECLAPVKVLRGPLVSLMVKGASSSGPTGAQSSSSTSATKRPSKKSRGS